MKKYIFYFVLLECSILFNSCSNDNNKTHSLKKSPKAPTKEQEIEKPVLGDTLFLGFRVNMDLDQIKVKTKQLYKNAILETPGGLAYAYRFYIDKQNFRLFLRFLSNGKQLFLDGKQNNFALDEIFLVETECYDLVGSGGTITHEGECFEENYREKLLQLYFSKYTFQKIEKTLKNQRVIRLLTAEEGKIESRKPRDKRAGIKEIKLPDGKSILYFNREKGISIICNYGFSEENVRRIQFQKIEIRYLTEKRLDNQIGSFNQYKKVKLEEEQKRKNEEERINAKNKEVFKNI